ncbi:MAG: CoA activase [Deltaproteobacteria bacterium]|nr:CoA activase [Deltaproteobacteria bacterium]
MRAEKVVDFQSLTENVGRFDLRDKTVLIPEMARIGSHVLAATFRGFGINAKVMDTCKGLDLGMEYTSGKECYPCQITMGDILYFLGKEQENQGDTFNPEDYVYFMPEAEGPCRFGMYNKYQRIVLDSFPQLSKVRIESITTSDGYSLDGMIEKDRVRDLRKSAYFCVVVTDILDRLHWRIRPYEKEPGMADDFISKSMHVMENTFETYASDKDFEKILDKLEEIVEEGITIIDPDIPPKPLIGVVGEIYLRTHVHANQDLIRVLERHGAEVVNASIAEWINFTTYEGLRAARKRMRLNLKQFRLGAIRENLEDIISFGGELLYQQFRQKQGYKRVRSFIDLAEDHRVAHLESILEEDDLYSFDAGTEACLSISGIVAYARDGYNGVVNVYPFTCMPSTTTSAIVRPLMNNLRIPYLDTPYDSSIQPGRETAIRTFMFQANQHFKRHGRKAH